MKLAAVLAVAATSTVPITSHGAGAVKLGMTYKQLRAKHLVGATVHGCELGGPNTRSAPLRAPLRGSVEFTTTRIRRVTAITIRRGAAAKGVGIGATISAIRA